MKLVHVLTVSSSLDFLRGQLRYMTGHGIELHLTASPDGDALALFAQAEGVTPHAVPMTRAMTPLADLRALWRLYRLLGTLEPDVVQAGTPKAGFLGVLAAFARRVPVRIYHMHGIRGMTAQGWQRRILMATEALTCRLATSVLCVSASTRQTALDAGLCGPEKIVVLGAGSCNGVDARQRFDPSSFSAQGRAELRARLQLSPEGPVLGFVGRVVRDKGIVELASAWEQLAREFPALQLVLVGPQEREDAVPRTVIDALRDHPRVRFVPQVADPAPYYSIMDLVILPTYREGLPNVPLEAAAMGLPVVATRVAGCVDAVVDGVTGTLVPARDAAALVVAAGRYLRDPALGRQHGTAARARVLRDYVPEELWARLLAYYRAQPGLQRGGY